MTTKQAHNKDVAFFEGVLKDSIKDIHEKYIKLAVANYSGRKPKYQIRERVYTYELYFQMRNRLNSTSQNLLKDYSLMGEVDKGGHPIFQNTKFKNKIPDFIIHKPGSMLDDSNLAVIEVKMFSPGKFRSLNRPSFKEVKADIRKLMGFLKIGKYEVAFFILASTENNKTQATNTLIEYMNKFSRELKILEDKKLSRRVKILLHADYNCLPEEIPWDIN
jgi:hypothetical protein